MAVKKSVIDIDVKDGAFKRLVAAVERYKALLTESVKEVEQLDAATTATAKAATAKAEKETREFLGKRKARKVAAAEAEAEAKKEVARKKKAAEDDKKAYDAERKKFALKSKQVDQDKRDRADAVRGLKDIAKWSGDIAWSTARGAVGLAKWAALGAIGGGFGLGGLASSAFDARRTSQGLGINSGELRAARVNFGAYVDPEAALGNIANAQSDLSKRWIFNALGERTEGKNAAEILPEILPKLVAAFHASGDTLQGAQARGLDQLVGIEDLRRLSALSRDELSKTIEAYRRDRESLQVDDSTNRDWQEFLISLHRAGQEIERDLIDGLRPLLPGLREFGHGVGEAIKSFLSNPHLKEWIEDFGKGIQKVGAYLGSEEFAQDIARFMSAMHKVAQWVGRMFEPDPDSPAAVAGTPNAPAQVGKWDATKHVYGAMWDHLVGNIPLSERNHNPGNLRIPGSTTGFQSFPDDNAGIRALANQLQLYQDDKHGHLDTISKILNVYSPSTENNTAALIKAASARTGFGADQHLDLSNTDQLVKLILAITKQENGRSAYTAEGVRIAIHDATGGNVATSVAALGAR